MKALESKFCSRSIAAEIMLITNPPKCQELVTHALIKNGI